MSKYTMELRQLFDSTYFIPQLYSRSDIENWFKDYELTDYLTQEEIDVINERGVWNKDKLARKIVDHYYMREIGYETPALFKHYAKINMQEIMEKYLPLIYSASIKYDPLVNVDYKEEFTRNIDKNNSLNGLSSSNLQGQNGTSGTNTSSSTSSGLNVNSDTPQGEITKTSILAGNYASSTSASENTISDSTTTSSSGTTSTSSSSTLSNSGNEETEETYTKNIKGNSGVSATAQKMIEQYRQNIIAIDRDIIKDLNILFMGLY